MIIVKKLRRATLSEFLEANGLDLKLEETTNKEGQIIVDAMVMHKFRVLRIGSGNNPYYALNNLIKQLNIIAGNPIENILVPYITEFGKEVENKTLV